MDSLLDVNNYVTMLQLLRYEVIPYNIKNQKSLLVLFLNHAVALSSGTAMRGGLFSLILDVVIGHTGLINCMKKVICQY